MVAVAPRVEPGPAPIRVCPACGVIAPTERAGCEVCGADFGAGPPVVPGGLGLAVWACILEADILCRVCGLRTPLHGVHLAPELHCERCGTTQAFDASQWRDCLGHAHEVASACAPRSTPGASQLHGCARCGVENDREWGFCSGCGEALKPASGPSSAYAVVGVSKTFASRDLQVSSSRAHTLRVKVSPGQPLCLRCHVPLVAELDGSGHIRTTCARCADVAVHGLPADAASVYAPLVAALAPEHRTDRPHAVLNRAQGAALAALACPTCGANLTVTSASDVITCEHCRTSALVPRQALASPGGTPKFSPFWVLLRWPYVAAARRHPGEIVVQQRLDADEALKKQRLKVVPWIIGIVAVAMALPLLIMLALFVVAAVVGGSAHRHHH